MAVLVGALGCGKAAPPDADCDAFAAQYKAKVSSPADGELTKKAIEVEALTYKGRCKADHWSAALADCVSKADKATDVFKTCGFSSEQAKQLLDTLGRQANDMKDAIKKGINGEPQN